MAYTVFFKELNQVFRSDIFIKEQPIGHHQLLTTIAEELSGRGTTSNPKAIKNAKGEWTVVVTDNAEVYLYTLYVSKLEMPEKEIHRSLYPEKAKTLVIIDPMGARDSVGGYHPGYWSINEFSDSLQENHRAEFFQTVLHIKQNIPSPNYSVEDDGSILIHIERKDKTSVMSVNCRARWIEIES